MFRNPFLIAQLVALALLTGILVVHNDQQEARADATAQQAATVSVR